MCCLSLDKPALKFNAQLQSNLLPSYYEKRPSAFDLLHLSNVLACAQPHLHCWVKFCPRAKETARQTARHFHLCEKRPLENKSLNLTSTKKRRLTSEEPVWSILMAISDALRVIRTLRAILMGWREYGRMFRVVLLECTSALVKITFPKWLGLCFCKQNRLYKSEMKMVNVEMSQLTACIVR